MLKALAVLAEDNPNKDFGYWREQPPNYQLVLSEESFQLDGCYNTD